jgi:hypothetical protein
VVASCGQASSALRNSVFNLTIGVAQLRDGTACVSDGAGSRDCDWRVELTRSERWNAPPVFLLAVVHSNHERGSGAWDSIFLWRCHAKKVESVFAARHQGSAKVELGKGADFWVTSSLWRRGDPTCCPSRERKEHFIWNDQRREFIRIAMLTRPASR